MRIIVGVLVCVVGCGFPQPKDVVGDGGGSSEDAAVDAPGDADAEIDAPPGPCNPLTQAGCATGEKCTWLVDTVMPLYTGHIGCAPNGSAAAGATCSFGAAGATGYDNCAKGNVCSTYKQPGQSGVCKPVCDQQGGAPACDGSHVCTTYASLFETDTTQPPAAGVCDPRCDPLTDNDFDGSANTLTGAAGQKRTSTCGTAANVGCYGAFSANPPGTVFTCVADINAAAAQPIGLRHRVQCIDANNCSNAGTVYVNSCNQGYLPLLHESSLVSTTICVAFCKPAVCYLGNCGTNNVRRHGVANDSCRDGDRVIAAGLDFSSFNGGATDVDGGEHCTHSWLFEIDVQNNLVKSPTSDTVGVCYNHEVYKWDSDNDGTIEQTDQPYPNCARLGSGQGSANYTGSDATVAFGALDFGCVPSSYIPMAANGKVAPEVVKAIRRIDLPRVLYHRTMGAQSR